MENNNQYYGNGNNTNNNSCNSNMPTIDDTNLDFSNLDMFSVTDMGELPHSASMDNILEELLQDTHVCTDTNTRDLGEDRDLTHHDDFHLQTNVLHTSSNNEEKSSDNDDFVLINEHKGKKRRRKDQGCNNREAVRKYREKIKAREAILEEEIQKLKDSNQQLLKRLEGERALHAEISGLKCLLVDIRGRIEGEISSFRYHKPSNTSFHRGYDHRILCNEHYGIGGKKLQLDSVLYDGGESMKVNYMKSKSVGTKPSKDIFIFGKELDNH
ncbi:basic leucine zipper 23-like [Chenopodium quinoa]|uniref:basic leucine zipper 23-like n=1 Tax=Chenopodium quinoa TaxID=63459 RepID=UPI000B7802D8|nr:basic leucine zipper 23-like [Chenopodium quinoa]